VQRPVSGLDAPVLAAILVLLSLLAFILKAPQRTSGDCAMYLQSGQLLLKGQRPYLDFIDVNPPMVMYLNMIPAAIARVSPFPPITTFNLLVWLLAVWAVWLTRHLIRQSPQTGAERVSDAVACGLALGNAVVLIGNNWGQREHLFLTAAFPYFAARLVRPQSVRLGRTPAVLLGLLVGAMACMKPHFVFIVAAVEAWALAEDRDWRALIRPEAVGVAVAGAVYALSLLLMGTEARHTFFGWLVPLVSGHYNNVFGISWSELLRKRGPYEGLAALALSLAIVPLRTPWLKRLLRLLGVLATAGTLMMLIQKKGWTYHLLPGKIALCVLVVVLVSEAFQFPRTPSYDSPGPFRPAMPRALLGALKVAIAGVGIACLLLAGRLIFGGMEVRQGGQNELAAKLEQITAPDDRVMLLDTSVLGPYPALTQADRFPGGRFLWLFNLPLFFDGWPRDGQEVPASSISKAEEDRLLDILARDIETRKPNLIGIQARGVCLNCPGISVQAYLKSRGFFERSMTNYQMAGTLDWWDLYAPRANGTRP
jgi:hypothetical protein